MPPKSTICPTCNREHGRKHEWICRGCGKRYHGSFGGWAADICCDPTSRLQAENHRLKQKLRELMKQQRTLPMEGL